VLDLGFRQSVLTVAIGRTVAYVRTLSTAADTWTRCLAQSFDSEYGEAESLKRRHGISDADGEGAPATAPGEQNMSRVVFDLLREQLDALVREVDLCCSYVVQSYTDVEMRRLILTGGGAALRGLSEFLSLHLGVPVQRLGCESVDGSRPAPRGLRLESPALLSLDGGLDFAAAVGSAMLDLEAA
jgi:Tfp pilus assembly PilM family ATPase